jgi:hypothetical protein
MEILSIEFFSLAISFTSSLILMLSYPFFSNKKIVPFLLNIKTSPNHHFFENQENKK